jgi:autotransporter family porin
LALDGGVSLTGGRLIIGSGGALTVHGTTGDNANITIQGIDSPQATFDGTVQIGESGNGSLSIVTGAVTITSTGVALEVGDGTVSNLLGQLTVTGDTLIGDRSGQTGIFSVSSATLKGALTLGENGGAGNATVSGGTLQVSGATILGQAAGDTGTLTATGAGTVLSVTGEIVIGEAGSGTVNVEDGAVVDAATSDVTVGDLAGSTGALSLTGSGVTMSAGSMDVGGEGAGTLTVDQGASLTVGGDLDIGADGSVAGSVNLADTDSTLSVGGNLVIGSGSLTVDDSATFDLKGSLIVGDEEATGSFADATSSPATHVIKGTFTLESPEKLEADCIIGDDTAGTLIIKSTFNATNSTLNANNNDVTIGSQKTGNGQLIVDGDFAKLDNIKSLTVGKSGVGSVLIKNGGYVHASTLEDGSSLASHQAAGAITVSSGGFLGVSDNALVGFTSFGSLLVHDDGFVGIGSVLQVGAKGHITVSSDSGIAVGGGGRFGKVGGGFVEIGNGGDVYLDCASGAYDAKTKIDGGRLGLDRTGAIAGADGISFAGAGTLLLNIGVTLSNKISGFAAGDTIDLEGVTADKDSYKPSSVPPPAER